VNDIFVITGVSPGIGQDFALNLSIRHGCHTLADVQNDGPLRTFPNEAKHQRFNGGSSRA